MIQDINPRFNTYEEAAAFAARNPGAEVIPVEQGLAGGGRSQQPSPNGQLDFLYQLVQANPDNKTVANAYLSALADSYDPYGANYQQKQKEEEAQFERAYKLAELYGSSDNPEDQAIAANILAPWSGMGGTIDNENQPATFDPYELFKKSYADRLKEYTTSENFNPGSPEAVRSAQEYQQLANISPEQYQTYSAESTPQERFQRTIRPNTATGLGQLLGGVPGGALASLYQYFRGPSDKERLNRVIR